MTQSPQTVFLEGMISHIFTSTVLDLAVTLSNSCSICTHEQKCLTSSLISSRLYLRGLDRQSLPELLARLAGPPHRQVLFTDSTKEHKNDL